MGKGIGVLCVAMGISIAGCGGDDASAGAVAIITDDATDVTAPGALLEGAFEVRDGCVVVTSTDEDAIAVWPSGSEFHDDDPAVVELESGERLRLDGTRYTVGGGFAGVTPEATACATRLDIAQVWLIAPGP